MSKKDLAQVDSRKAGYAALIERFGIEVIPNWHRSRVAANRTHRINSRGDVVEEVYPSSYWPGDSAGDHLEFALKYDGTNLAILARLFEVIGPEEIQSHVQATPLGKYARRLWFFYEFLTGKRLPLEDLGMVNYVDLLDPEDYYTSVPARKISRQKVNDNLLGNSGFCPLVRRTEKLRSFESANLTERCREAVSDYPPALIKRALSYLYTKETKSSFEIEHINPDAKRTERFVALLQLAEREDFCDKEHLVELENRIVADPRFQMSDYRKDQNYVGETVSSQKERVHFACPKPEDVPSLMDGLIDAHRRMNDGGVSTVVHAAAVGYGFVFLHPFGDGNGRIHRFLIHNILARRGFTPKDIMFPVSASMLKAPADYNASLETFSVPLLPLVDYSLDEAGHMTVHNETAVWYRYIDMTPQAEALFVFIERTIKTELIDEFTFLENYDRAKKAVQEIVDMPDEKIDLFIRCCLQNHAMLGARKRTSHFSFLSDKEVSQMETAVQSEFSAEAGKGSKV